MDKPKLAIATVEMMVSWATQWPDLFLRSVESFREKYPHKQFKHKIRLDRPGYILLIAQAR